MIRQLVILAGGKGTRLKAATGGLPKPLVPIGDIPILEHQVRQASRTNFTEVVFLTSYRSQLIADHFRDGSQFGVNFKYHVDETPLGTAGALLAVLDQLDDDFLLLYGDAMHDVDLRSFANFHEQHPGAAASLFVHPNDHPHDSDLVELDPQGRILAFHGYPHPPGTCYRNIVNAGLYALRKSFFESFCSETVPCDFAKDLFPKLLATNHILFGYSSREYIKDMGTVERLEKVNADFRSGKVARMNRNRAMPAVFLDRDGTVLAYRSFLSKTEEVHLRDGSAQAICTIHEAGYLAVLVTNQPVIARGECTYAELERIHGKMEHMLATEGNTYLDAIYYCPHHPDSGYPGEIPDLKVWCNCRKPATGMISHATTDLNIDLRASFLIGDSIRDWNTAENAQIPGLLLRGGEASDSLLDTFPVKSVFQNLLTAVRSLPVYS